ncbi:MAG: hypothetical protein ACI4UE_05580 [Candidatus Scatovivens sp.]
MSCLNNCCGNELVIFSSIISVSISKNFTCDELDILGNFFSSLGANLSTIAAANSNCCSNNNTDNNNDLYQNNN